MNHLCSFHGDKAVSVLFDEETDKALGKAMYLIANDRGNFYGELLKVCQKETRSVDTVARIVAGTAIASPIDAHLWLENVSAWLFTTLDLENKSRFQLGVTLGLFEASQWFDEEGRAKEQFKEEFPSVVTRLVLAQTTVSAKDLKDPISGRLSSPIKAWACPNDNKGVRLAQVERTNREICEGINKKKAEDKNFKLSPLGDFILDQITYAAFGQFTPSARAKAIRYIYDDMSRWFKNRAKEVEKAKATGSSIPPTEETC